MPAPKIYKTQQEFNDAWSSEDADFKDAVFEPPVNFSLRPFNGKANFSGAVFKGHADFTNIEFHGKVDFTGAVFENGASFENAKFLTRGQDVLFEKAVFKSPKSNVTFENAQFGLPYQREFGEWQIGFKRNEGGFSFLRRMKAEKPAGKFEDLGDCSIGNMQSFLKTHAMEDHSIGINSSRGRYREAPRDVFFNGCRFENGGIVSFTSVGFNNSGSVDFNSARFANSEGVYFGSAHFMNGESIYLDSANFTNDGDVSFKSIRFDHGNSASFKGVKFANRGHVDFSYAEFENGGYVNFESCWFANEKHVDFSSVNFANGGQVWFLSAGFFNGRHVRFDSAKFINGGDLNFKQIIWANSGSLLWWKQVEFKETAAVKFDECLFLSKGVISFGDIRFPEKGSVMFQRCYFTSTQVIDFSEAVFRHTTFEGGRIYWLKDQKERSLIAILKDRLKERFDDLPKLAKERIEKLNMVIPKFSRVFAPGVEVCWKDLTTESAKNLTFRLTNLSGSIFDGMTPTHIQLNAPEWAKYKDRTALYEEKKLRDAGGKLSMEELRNIEDQYTQLKNNLERQGNYLHAGDFHYGEQEIRRERLLKEQGTWKNLGNLPIWVLTWFYKFLSGYGERPWRAALIFFILLFVLTLNNFIGYDSMRFDKYTSFWGLKVFKSFVHIVVPFSWKDKVKKIGISNWCPYLVFILGQLFLILIQLPLMILAIRRRFKR